MYGGVLNSLTRKLGQTATKGEAGRLAGLVGGEGAIAKSAPKMTEQVAEQIIYHGTPNKFTKFRNDGGSTWFTSNKDKMKDSGLSWNGQGELNIMERKLPSDIKLATRDLEDKYTRWELEGMGYKGIKYDDIGPDEIYYEMFDPNKLPLNEAVPKVMPKNSLTGKVDMTPDDINMFREDIKSALYEGGFDDVAIDSLDHIGSTRLGTARPDSDLDLVMRYKGDAREDDVFNLLNDYVEQNGLEFNGRKVDINPIRSDDIEQYRQLLTDAGVNVDDVAPYLGGDGGNDLLKYINTTNPEFVAKKNLGAKTMSVKPKTDGVVPDSDVLKSYAGNDHTLINTHVKGRTLEQMDKRVRDKVEVLDRNMVDDIPAGTYYRGMVLTQSEIDNMVKTGKFKNDGYSSTSTDMQVADKFTYSRRPWIKDEKPVIFQLDVKDGQKGIDLTRISKEAARDNEKLLPRNAEYIIKNVSEVDGKYIVDAEYAPANSKAMSNKNLGGAFNDDVGALS